MKQIMNEDIKKEQIIFERIKDHTFYLGDVFDCFKYIEDESVDLIFTSPPYNVGIEYDNWNDKLSYREYLNFIKNFIKESYRVLKNDGRFAINVPSITADGEYKALFNDVINISHEIGFKIRNDIIWYKHQVSKRTAWGSFASPSDPYVVQPYEFILIFNKKDKKHIGLKENIDITKEEFIKFTLAFWNIKPETRKTILSVCPAPFPEELAYRVVKLYTYRNDLVLDPFGGSGTTNVVCARLGRRSIYIDNSKKAFEFAIKRLKTEINKMF